MSATPPLPAPGGCDSPAPSPPSLSPSRASDFKSCPLRFRFRTVDRIPERPSSDAARGTLVHAVLERLHDLPPAQRLPQTAASFVGPEFERLLAGDEELRELVEQTGVADWLAPVHPLLDSYFSLEDPRRIGPGEREQLVSAELDWGLTLRGYVDRLDIAPTGELRVVDYKTGRSPSDAFAGQAMFQLRFYALAIWRSRGVLPRQLLIMYLRDRDVLTYSPTEDELLRFERTLQSLWRAMDSALESGDFRPNRGRLCDWCDFRALCPAWDGTPPPYPGRSGTRVTVAATEETR